MKYLILLTALLAGCSGEITTQELDDSILFCKDKGGIRALRITGLETNKVFCMDDTVEFITNL